MGRSRQERVRQAFFRGEALTLENPRYLPWVHVFTEDLLGADVGPGDLTLRAVLPGGGRGTARVMAREPGVLAGLEEVSWFYTRHGLRTERLKADGQRLEPGDAILRAEGNLQALLIVERVGLNLLQRMSGIATRTRELQELAYRYSPATFVVATRKTPWGPVDKRAVHLGGGGTHRLGLGDAILIKTNHLRLLAASEEEAIPLALKRAWSLRAEAVFIEVEVTALKGALAAARVFEELRREEADPPPSVVMLDNVPPTEVSRIVGALKEEGLHDGVLIEASGKISEATIAEYASSGVDAISVGALTHSPRALDLRQAIE